MLDGDGLIKKKSVKGHLISIIVPVYEVENYLDKCIESIVNQTYTNLEIILIDDGSKDLSSQKCDNWAAKDSRIKVIHTQNHGVSHARNLGLHYMHGDYVGFVDADDWLDLEMYTLMMKEIDRTGAEICGVGYTIEENDKSLKILKQSFNQVFSREDILCQIFQINSSKILGWELWDKLFSKKLISNLYFDENIILCEDMLFFWQAMKKVTKFAYLPLYSYHYRMRPGSAIHDKNIAKNLTRRYAVERIYKDSLKEPITLKNILWNFFSVYQIQIAKDMMLLSAKKYEEEIKTIQRFVRKNLFRIIRIPNQSLRNKLGALYFSCPYSLIVYMRKFI